MMRGSRRLADAAPGVWAAGCAAAVCGVILALAAIIGAGPTSAVDGTDTTLRVVAIVSLAVIAVCTGVTWWIDHGARGGHDNDRIALRRCDTVAVAALAAAWLGAGVLTIVAFRIGSRRDLLVLVDENAATVCALAGAGCALALLGCLSRAARRAGDGDSCVDTRRRRRALAMGVAGTTAAIVVFVMIPALSDASRVVRGPDTVDAVDVPAMPTSMGAAVFRSSLTSRLDSAVLPAGAGYVVRDGHTLTAFDGRDGSVRWRFDASALGEDVGVRTVDGPDGEVLVVAGDRLLVGLDAMTGRLLWRSSDTTKTTTDESTTFRDLRTGRVERTVEHQSCLSRDWSVRFIVWTSCDVGTTVTVADWATGSERRVDLPAIGADEQSGSVILIGHDMFAIPFARMSDDEHRPTGQRRYVLVDAVRAVVVDDFTTSSDPTEINAAGVLVMHGSDDTVEFRDTLSKRTIRVADVPGGDRWAGTWIGTTYAVGSSDGEIRIIDPATRTVTARNDVCTPGQFRTGAVTAITVAPGAVVVECKVEYMPFDIELVGLTTEVA
ncbi:hypothetical protein nbrc107696_29900 [Gordonia spumicola]|uniref:Pyrrolo-quinoline quinone repeat domain-containing protein n=1 Tax=Gordonia spumicola TaxID=589161 RepID=A0A7I9VB96_9ACTN|nr:PQQ-binding-like beta-propeller repeat protein [Gordonia spumicola]GEE02544.1 hypothetical protein nbrc107696_29900 [Gordonia spumicola]